MTYTAKQFNLSELAGLSAKQIEVHLALYQGYVKHTNLIMENIAAYKEADPEGNAYAINELRRRLGFEFNGMRMHEYYFEQLEGADALNNQPSLTEAVEKKYGGTEQFIAHLQEVAGTRGIGWVVVYYDAVGNTLHTAFVNDHELGQLGGLAVILAIDLWEHAYMVDYIPAQKSTYLEAFLSNVNWSIPEARLNAARQ